MNKTNYNKKYVKQYEKRQLEQYKELLDEGLIKLKRDNNNNTNQKKIIRTPEENKILYEQRKNKLLKKEYCEECCCYFSHANAAKHVRTKKHLEALRFHGYLKDFNINYIYD